MLASSSSSGIGGPTWRTIWLSLLRRWSKVTVEHSRLPSKVRELRAFRASVVDSSLFAASRSHWVLSAGSEEQGGALKDAIPRQSHGTRKKRPFHGGAMEREIVSMHLCSQVQEKLRLVDWCRMAACGPFVTVSSM